MRACISSSDFIDITVTPLSSTNNTDLHLACVQLQILLTCLSMLSSQRIGQVGPMERDAEAAERVHSQHAAAAGAGARAPSERESRAERAAAREPAVHRQPSCEVRDGHRTESERFMKESRRCQTPSWQCSVPNSVTNILIECGYPFENTELLLFKTETSW